MSGVSMVNGHIDEPKKTCNECMHYELCKYNAHQRAIYLEKDKELYINIDNHIACKFFKCESNKTNYDRIRNMSVEEMAEMITALFHEEHLKLATRLKENGINCTLVEIDHDLQVAIHQNWLESEVTGNG